MQHHSPSQRGWAFLLLAIFIIAGLLRFWQVGDAPPGFYRDEAFNGLDALQVVEGQHALFFTTNNGREPAYIYLTALSILVWGRTVLAVRLGAALIGTLTTIPVYLLGQTWFGRLTGLLAAWLWAVTLWPVHLSRVGLRPILLAPCLALTFWSGTLAYRRNRPGWWIVSGLLYGLSFYTYLAMRFTPLLLLLFLAYLWFTRPEQRRRIWSGLLYFLAGAALIGLPLAVVFLQDPTLLTGRAGQVSIFNPTINQGNFWAALWQHTWQAVGMFLWRGDTILRHNPAGRPVFDLFMAVPFLVGLLYSLRHWRRPAAALLLLWTVVMLGPTIFADDTPHFLRAAGLLPAILIIPALGLSKIPEWPKLRSVLATGRSRLVWLGLLLILSLATMIMTVRDYFFDYTQQADTAYLFEAALRDLAQDINNEPAGTTIYTDLRYWRDWPTLSFLVEPSRPVNRYALDPGPTCPPPACDLPLSIYAWPHESLEFIPRLINPPALVSAQTGSLGRNDLEPDAYPVFVHYAASPAGPLFGDGDPLANFDNQAYLYQADITTPTPTQLEIDLIWTTPAGLSQPIAVFVHVVDGDNQIVAQSDGEPAQGHWPGRWWQPGLQILDRHSIPLPLPFDQTRHRFLIGLVDTATQQRLPLIDAAGQPAGDAWQHRQNE